MTPPIPQPSGAADYDPTDGVPAAPAPPRASRPRILLIENNLDQAESLGDMLNSSGYDCDIAESIALARQLMTDTTPGYDLMIADLRLTAPEHVTFVVKARALPGYEALPIIIRCGFDSQEARRVAHALGIEDYLLKPVSTTNTLLPLIRRWIARKRQ